MNFFQSRGPTPSPGDAQQPPPDTVEVIRLHARQMERARQQRDEAIALARATKAATLREIGEAAGISVSRVKQIDSRLDPRSTLLKAPVTEVDLLRPLASADGDPGDERVLLLEDVDPYLQKWPSERAFIDADERRHPFMDLFWDIYDGDAQEHWRLRYCSGTKEIYAWTDRNPDPTYANEKGYGGGATSGPCIVLGHVLSWTMLERCLDRSLRHVAQRPGGLAWVYGRVQLLNRMLDALSRDYTTPTPGAILTYLSDTLPESEKPR